jgi:hypothetical protein
MQPQPQPLVIEDVVEALIDPHAPATDPLVQAIQVAMSGFGYNFYDARNVARSNDQLVRERAAGLLGEAVGALGAFERGYRERNVPAATRETPFPPDDVMRRVRALDALRKRVEAAIAALASAETPATDSIWFRFRDERTLLLRLVSADVELALGAQRLRDAAAALAGAHDDAAALEPLGVQLDEMEGALTKRRALLRAG